MVPTTFDSPRWVVPVLTFVDYLTYVYVDPGHYVTVRFTVHG